MVIKLYFCAAFEYEVWSILEVEVQARFFSWSLVSILQLMFGRDANVWLRFLSWYLVEILMMKFDQDLCFNLFELW